MNWHPAHLLGIVHLLLLHLGWLWQAAQVAIAVRCHLPGSHARLASRVRCQGDKPGLQAEPGGGLGIVWQRQRHSSAQ